MQHAGQLGINAVLTLTDNDVWNVNSRNRFTNEGPVFGIFKLNRFGGFQLGRIGSQLAVGETAFGRGVCHFTQCSFALTGRHIPFLCSCHHQHFSGCGACFAQVLL